MHTINQSIMILIIIIILIIINNNSKEKRKLVVDATFLFLTKSLYLMIICMIRRECSNTTQYHLIRFFELTVSKNVFINPKLIGINICIDHKVGNNDLFSLNEKLINRLENTVVKTISSMMYINILY